MTLGEKIREQRTSNGLSQESIANMIGVSRQAVTKWESGQTTPSSDNLIALAKIFHIPLDELIFNHDTREQFHGKKPNQILRTNLIKAAIVLHAGLLHGCTVIYYNVREKPFSMKEWSSLFFEFFLLLLCSIWMASNHRYEDDIQQRKKNAQIELAYCFVQFIIALLTMRYSMGLIGACLTIMVGLIYILEVNPKYMNRKLTK